MLKKQRELQDFRAAFSFLKGEKVVFYGTGQYTELLIQEDWEFQLIGLMDQNKTGKACFGLPVLSEEEVLHSGCKVIIIISNLSTAPIIWRRLKEFCRKSGVDIYYMNGRKPSDEDCLPAEFTARVAGRLQLLDTAMRYDVISFDLFDTLIMRKCLFPEAVFSIVKRKAEDCGIILEDFPKRRREAEKALYHGEKPFYTLDDIYLWLRESYALSSEQAMLVKSLELETELEMVFPRTDIVECCKELLSIGKQVIITSDMYLTRAQMKLILEKCGLPDMTVYISCVCGASKHIGTLFDRLRDDFHGKHILHIGDNLQCDIKNAQKKGIDTLWVPNAAAQMDTWGLNKIKAENRQLYALFVQKCFSRAFSEEKRILISSAKDLGYLFFGPLAVGYLIWLANQMQKDKIGHLLFIARDGYIFYRLYQRLRKVYAGLPQASYFLTSRRCVSVAAIKNTADIRFIFEDICCNRDMCLRDVLEKAYGIAADEDDKNAVRTLGEFGADAWMLLEERYMDRILTHAAKERANYFKYINTLGLSAQNIGMMNFVGRGVTQRCLNSLFGKQLTGYYFALEYDASYILDSETEAYSWYPERLSTHTGKRKLAEQLLLGETVFSAPHGTVTAFTDSGQPIYAAESPSRSRLIQACHQGILEYFDDILQMRGCMELFRDTVDISDEIFGLLRDSRFQFSEEICSGFLFEDQYQPNNAKGLGYT